MNKITSVSIGVALVVIVAGLVFWQKNTPSPLPTGTTVATTTTSSTIRDIPNTEVTMHSSRTSCWSTINGNVYDLTSWIPNHPGGEQAILQLCGADGSAKFNEQHGGAPRQAAILAGFKIGSATK